MTERPVSVRLPGRLRDTIETMRQDDRRSMNAQIIVLLEEAVAARGTPDVDGGGEHSGGTERASVPPRPATGVNRRGPCPHRTPKGAYCKRCQRVI
jgi:hypothetical protein